MKEKNHPKQLKKILANHKLTIAPGVFDGLSAKLAAQAGFELIYASGGAISRSAGLPDLGLLSLNEVCHSLANIIEAVKIPVIADADTGFGNELNVRRTVQKFEQLGAAGLHIEDQVFPKRCGHLTGKQLISQAEMVMKIKAAKNAAHDIVIIARTDAIAVEGFDAALERAEAYVAAGADMIFVEAPESIQQIEKIAGTMTVPKLINMFYGGKTPLISTDTLTKLGYNVVIIPSDLQRAAIHAMQQVLTTIKQEGDSAKIADQLTSFKEREEIIGTEAILKKLKS